MKYALILFFPSLCLADAASQNLANFGRPPTAPPPQFMDRGPRNTFVTSGGGFVQVLPRDNHTDYYGVTASGNTWNTRVTDSGIVKGTDKTGQYWEYNPNNFFKPMYREGE